MAEAIIKSSANAMTLPSSMGSPMPSLSVDAFRSLEKIISLTAHRQHTKRRTCLACTTRNSTHSILSCSLFRAVQDDSICLPEMPMWA